MYPLTSGRWWKWLYDRRLTCCDGHHLPNVFQIDESGSLRCNHWISEGPGSKQGHECGKWVWIMSFDRCGNLVVDVSLEDLKRIKNLGTPAQRIAYLGIFEGFKDEAI